MKKIVKVLSFVSAGMAALAAGELIFLGREAGIGPFRKLFKGFDGEVSKIQEKYDAASRKGEIIFYGASNFRLWTEMENDLPEYKVQNHGFGGCTDKDLVKYADRILYPYEPSVVFFQTGSNDYVALPGTDEEKVEKCMAYKREMFSRFHEQLPNAHFVVMSGLLLPGRKQFTALTREINRQLDALCQEHSDYMTFVNAEEMTLSDGVYRDNLFRKDQIHLNHEGQLLWRDGYILPALEKLKEKQ